MRTAERPQREGQCGQQPVQDRKQELARIESRRDRKRNDAAEHSDDGERQTGADARADQRREQRDQQDLRAVDAEYVGAGGARGFHGRDRVALAREVTGDRIGDADAADQQCGQGDEGQELAETLDIALELRRSLFARADVPAGIREVAAGSLFECDDGAVGRVRCRQPQPILPAHQAAGLQKRAGAQRLLAHQKARAKSDAAGQSVRLVLEYGAQLDRCLADGDAVAELEIKPRQQCRIGGRAKGIAVALEQIGQRQVGLGSHGAEQRIRAVDGFDLDQRGSSVIGARHGRQRGDDRHLAVRIKKAPLAVSGLTLDQREIQIAAEDRAAGLRQTIGQALRHRADAGDCHDAERDAGDENAEAAQAAAQLAPSIAQRERCHRTLTAGEAGSSSRPEWICSTRSQRCASVMSWVTSTSVVPCWR